MTIVLVRHPPVAVAWRRRCYGVNDAPLGREGKAMIGALIERLRPLGIERIVHSDLARTRVTAEGLARALKVELIVDRDWRERDFGAWEGRTWHAIWRETGDAMDGMVTDPASFRPGGNGETTLELRDRVMRALARLPQGRIAVLSHGGPVATVLGMLGGYQSTEWPTLIPACGSFVVVPRPFSRNDHSLKSGRL